MYFVGSTVSDVALTTRNASGALEADAGVVFTVTRPDGTTSTPATTNPSLGTYQALYVPTMAGRHTWTATTTSHGPQSGLFNVEPLTSGAIVSLAEARAHLNALGTQTTNDEELRFHILTASRVIESFVGPVAARTYTQTVRNFDSPIVLDHTPVLSVTSVTPAGAAALNPASMSVDLDAGLIYPAYGYYWPTYAYGATTVVYVAGRTTVPAEIRMATLDLIRLNWRPQQGGGHSAFDTDLGAGETRLGFFVPNSLVMMLRDELTPPAVA